MTGPHDSLEQALICLLEQRELASKLSGSLRARRDDFELTLADDVAASKELVAQMSETEEEVRGLALAAYDGVNKHVAPGVEVKIFTAVEYDSDVALAWAVKHGIFLQLHRTEFERFAKGSTSTVAEFVVVREEPRAQIATNLRQALS